MGCSNDDIPCLCLNEDFGNGIRDCTNESCPGNANKKAVLEVGATFCSGECNDVPLKAAKVG